MLRGLGFCETKWRCGVGRDRFAGLLEGIPERVDVFLESFQARTGHADGRARLTVDEGLFDFDDAVLFQGVEVTVQVSVGHVADFLQFREREGIIRSTQGGQDRETIGFMKNAFEGVDGNGFIWFHLIRFRVA